MTDTPPRSRRPLLVGIALVVPAVLLVVCHPEWVQQAQTGLGQVVPPEYRLSESPEADSLATPHPTSHEAASAVRDRTTPPSARGEIALTGASLPWPDEPASPTPPQTPGSASGLRPRSARPALTDATRFGESNASATPHATVEKIRSVPVVAAGAALPGDQAAWYQELTTASHKSTRPTASVPTPHPDPLASQALSTGQTSPTAQGPAASRSIGVSDHDVAGRTALRTRPVESLASNVGRPVSVVSGPRPPETPSRPVIRVPLGVPGTDLVLVPVDRRDLAHLLGEDITTPPQAALLTDRAVTNRQVAAFLRVNYSSDPTLDEALAALGPAEEPAVGLRRDLTEAFARWVARLTGHPCQIVTPRDEDIVTARPPAEMDSDWFGVSVRSRPRDSATEGFAILVSPNGG